MLTATVLANEPEGDAISSVLGSLEPVGEEILEASRGGAALPGGVEIQITGMMRMLDDGVPMSAVAGGLSAASHGPAATELILRSQGLAIASGALGHPLIVNSLDGVSLELYREITIRVQNLPIPQNRVPMVPGVIMPHMVGGF